MSLLSHIHRILYCLPRRSALQEFVKSQEFVTVGFYSTDIFE